ncbi:uncharacterized protein LOC143148229 [Ptiloglossa arizonensis]|uniref:uncharacterized protein LOC143148229 n=1 Tax=Ptiloglossa arizonensis TaxID=3350558 RepID=UPI003FA057BC
MIQTFIFFDLETTGLIGKSIMPKITELSLIAVSRSTICNTMKSLPRVLHKLVLPIHPCRQIPKHIKMLTDLSDENLEDVQSFNCKTYDLVVNFIDRLKAPICFVAYNGNNFDYPIFLSELKNINKVLREDILSIDMLHLIKDFFAIKKNSKGQASDAQVNTVKHSNTESVNILLNDGLDTILSDALDSVMSSNCNNDNKNKSSVSSMPNTPKTSYYKKIQTINEKTPESQIVKVKHYEKKFYYNKVTSVRRRLDYTTSQPINFKLSSISEHILGIAPKAAHTAEGDCLTMIRCAIELGIFFAEWSDSKAVPMINHSIK